MPWVASMAWDEVAQVLAAGCDALLPVGAAAKEHGLHLPMDTDAVQAEWLAERLDRRFGLLVWPTVTYGYYPAFRDFPGSISLGEATFRTMLGDIADDILRHGARRLLILNTGISTLRPIDRLLAERGYGPRCLHLKIHDGPRYRAAVERLRSQAYGSHADEMETSRMLAIAPGRVRMERAEASPGGPFDGPLTLANAPSGSYGDPTKATAEKGRVLLDAMLEDLAAAITG